MNHLDNPSLHLSITYMVVKYSMIFYKETRKNKRKTFKTQPYVGSLIYQHKALREMA
jgi:hypothetical protein